MAPSTIAVYGCPPAPRDFCGDDAVQRPTTMYGLTKAHQELLGEYYFKKAGVDYRSFRLPGVISADAPPGGGTTDYACAIFAAALTTKKFDCYLSADAELPFAHMEDVLSGAARLLQAPGARLSRRTYSVSGFSATPAQWAGAVAARVPGFKVSFSPDFRDGIARSWPASLDDSNARRDWGWNPLQGLEPTTDAMLARVDSILRSSDEAARAWGVPPLRGRSVVVGGMAAAAAASTTTTSLSAAP
jgi:threonine 3-dehydrogenase